MSDINGDPRKPYYLPVKTYTKTYATEVKKWDGTYGNMFHMCNPEELVNWDGIVSRNVNRNVYDPWNPSQENQYDYLTVNTMGIHRFLDIKGAKKLCSHHTETKKGEEGYDPTQKYRLVWDVTTHNVNQCLERGGLDLSIDEITWPNGSYSGMHHRLRGKKHSKGGQHTIVADARDGWIYAWTPRHNLFKRVAQFTQEGPAEVVRLMNELTPLVVGEKQEAGDTRSQLFTEKPCLAMDNHFSGRNVDHYLGINGYKGVYTCARGRLQASVKKYYHYVKDVDVGPRSRAARFANPVVPMT